MKYDLVKFHHWLLVSTFKSKWFEDNFKLQIISLLSWFLYPEFRKQNTFLSIVRNNKIVMSIFTIFLIWSITFFTFGRLTSDSSPTIIKRYFFKNEIVDTTTTTKLVFDKGMRKFIEYTAKEKYKIKNFHNLQQLPDEVFFTIVSEINDKKIPYSLFFRLLDQESNFKNVVNKNSGARGLVQVIPSTERTLRRRIGTTGHYLIDNIRMGSAHLSISYHKYKQMGLDENQCWFKSLMDYNGGNTKLAEDNLLYFHKELENTKKGD
jgi:hypothetical protein